MSCVVRQLRSLVWWVWLGQLGWVVGLCVDPFTADFFMSLPTAGSGLKGGEQKLQGLLRPKLWNTKVTFCQILSVKESYTAKVQMAVSAGWPY